MRYSRPESKKSSSPRARYDVLRQNQLLARLPGPERRRLGAIGEKVKLTLGQVLYEQGKEKQHVYFPIDSYISQLSSLAGVPRLEVALVGSEGMVGTSVLLGVPMAPLYTLVQGEGTALRLESPQFIREFRRSAALGQVMNRYLYVRLSQLGQMAACTRFHLLEARLARWLLMTRDRAHSDMFPITQAYMAYMLGVRRVGITQAASLLQERRLILYKRGAMTIVSGRGLEAASCECYATAQQTYARHLK